MIREILTITGISVLEKSHQRSIHGGTYGCQNVARKCTEDSDYCSGSCGVEKIINGRPIVLSICSFS